MRKIEILSPAKNLETGISAILHGADAVYIGADKFGARAYAGNSVEDIKKLVEFARPYFVKVYVAFNTVLTDEQMPDAEKLIHQLYEIGVDALIIQDMGILRLNLPPIQIHASTQTDNRTADKVNFLRQSGFSRVVLARELSLNEISKISESVEVELEAFVNGALCVSYSGQCYISQSQCGRSANRGECAQFCRLPYQLYDADNRLIVKNSYLLSMKDLDLSEHIEELIDAGVCSLKIEGRMKNTEYVKNTTSLYRLKVDEIIGRRNDLQRSSSGNTRILFHPDPDKTFRRNSTTYFLNGRQQKIFQPDSPKSLGEPIGKVISIKNKSIIIDTDKELKNGDGFCFKQTGKDLVGFRANTAQANEIFPDTMPEIAVGDLIYRNYDMAFQKILSGKTSERKIPINISFKDTETGILIQITDKDNISSQTNFDCEKTLSKSPERVYDNFRQQLSKTGASIYQTEEIEIKLKDYWFFTNSQINDWRRQAIEFHTLKRIESYKREFRDIENKNYKFNTEKLSYLGNVTNEFSKQFYREHGVKEIQPGFEIKAQKGVPVMFTRHCIKYEFGWCPKNKQKSPYNEPFYLENQGNRYTLEFDCKNCQMLIYNQ